VGVEVLVKGIDLRMKQAEDGGSEGYVYHEPDLSDLYG